MAIGVFRAIGDVASGAINMTKDVFTGHPIKALEEGVHTGLATARDVVSDPLIDSAVGFAVGGPVGAMAGNAIGQGVGGLLGAADGALCQSTGVGPWAPIAAMQKQNQQMRAQMNQHLQSYGQQNGAGGFNPQQFQPHPFPPYSGGGY